jgi:GAF domain-containing protein
MGELVPFFAILMVFSVGFFALWLEHRRKVLQHNAETAATSVSQIHRELEQRIRVLERIVTDRGYHLATQIDALHEPLPAKQAEERA